MPKIIAGGIGTYYKWKGGYSGLNAEPLQKLVWLAKNNRQGSSRSCLVCHPAHPLGKEVLLQTPDQAYDYVAEVIKAIGLIERVAGTRPRVLVPVPASSTTRSSAPTERWPALGMARALERKGLGDARICVVNKEPMPSKTGSGIKPSAGRIASNIDVIEEPAVYKTVVWVDDIITFGNTLVGTNHALSPIWSAAICIAFTAGGDGTDCYGSRVCEIEYDHALAGNVLIREA